MYLISIHLNFVTRRPSVFRSGFALKRASVCGQLYSCSLYRAAPFAVTTFFWNSVTFPNMEQAVPMHSRGPTQPTNAPFTPHIHKIHALACPLPPNFTARAAAEHAPERPAVTRHRPIVCGLNHPTACYSLSKHPLQPKPGHWTLIVSPRMPHSSLGWHTTIRGP
jgi:hypothetical protein